MARNPMEEKKTAEGRNSMNSFATIPNTTGTSNRKKGVSPVMLFIAYSAQTQKSSFVKTQ
jgi:hypothetical protein